MLVLLMGAVFGRWFDWVGLVLGLGLGWGLGKCCVERWGEVWFGARSGWVEG